MNNWPDFPSNLIMPGGDLIMPGGDLIMPGASMSPLPSGFESGLLPNVHSTAAQADGVFKDMLSSCFFPGVSSPSIPSLPEPGRFEIGGSLSPPAPQRECSLTPSFVNSSGFFSPRSSSLPAEIVWPWEELAPSSASAAPPLPPEGIVEYLTPRISLVEELLHSTRQKYLHLDNSLICTLENLMRMILYCGSIETLSIDKLMTIVEVHTKPQVKVMLKHIGGMSDSQGVSSELAYASRKEKFLESIAINKFPPHVRALMDIQTQEGRISWEIFKGQLTGSPPIREFLELSLQSDSAATIHDKSRKRTASKAELAGPLSAKRLKVSPPDESFFNGHDLNEKGKEYIQSVLKKRVPVSEELINKLIDLQLNYILEERQAEAIQGFIRRLVALCLVSEPPENLVNTVFEWIQSGKILSHINMLLKNGYVYGPQFNNIVREMGFKPFPLGNVTTQSAGIFSNELQKTVPQFQGIGSQKKTTFFRYLEQVIKTEVPDNIRRFIQS